MQTRMLASWLLILPSSFSSVFLFTHSLSHSLSLSLAFPLIIFVGFCYFFLFSFCVLLFRVHRMAPVSVLVMMVNVVRSLVSHCHFSFWIWERRRCRRRRHRSNSEMQVTLKLASYFHTNVREIYLNMYDPMWFYPQNGCASRSSCSLAYRSIQRH